MERRSASLLRKQYVASLLALSGLTTGCTGNDTDGGSHPVCIQSFTATVRSGPSQGSELTGLLILSQTDADDVVGELLTPDGTIGMSGRVDPALSLTFTMEDGKTIQGTDPKATDLATQCPTQLEGALTGPEAGDAGDWLGQGIYLNPDPNDSTLYTLMSPNGNVYTTGGNGALCVTNGDTVTTICRVGGRYVVHSVSTVREGCNNCS